jgi:hypothetical protein
MALLTTIASTLAVLSVADARLESRYRGTAASILPVPNTSSENGPSSEPGDSFDPVVASDDLFTWDRENSFLMTQNSLRQGWGPELRSQTPETKVADDRIHVVVAGDSYVWGQGAEDLDMLWPRQLELELNRLQPDRYRVTRLGRLPSSTMQVADWLHPERIAELDPDVIVFGYLNNDFFPTLEERSLCRRYATCTEDGEPPFAWNPRNGPLVACIRGDDSVLGKVFQRLVNPLFPYVGRWLINRYCDPDRAARNTDKIAEGIWMSDPAANPYWEHFTEATRRLATDVGTTPIAVYVYDSAFDDASLPKQRAVRDAFTDAGMTVLQPIRVEELRSRTQDHTTHWINPGDSHPGMPLTRMFALDVAQYIRSLPLTRPNTPSTTQRELLSNYLPATLTVDSDVDSARIQGSPLTDEFVSANGMQTSVRGKPTPLQETPCARMGRPHVRLMFDPYTPTGTKLRVSLGNTGGGLVAQTTGYDVDGNEVRGVARLVNPGSSFVIDVVDGVNGLLLGERRAGCPNERLQTPIFDLHIERLLV